MTQVHFTRSITGIEALSIIDWLNDNAPGHSFPTETLEQLFLLIRNRQLCLDYKHR